MSTICLGQYSRLRIFLASFVKPNNMYQLLVMGLCIKIIKSSVRLSPTDQYLAKRRTANHPCPVCGKHYVNEGSLRKHLACHPETSQLTTSLRMWPCSVCQAVFTHETG